MFYKLIDLVRSPELIKTITKECDEHVNRNRDRHIKEQVWVVKRKIYLEKLQEMKDNEKKRSEIEKKRLKRVNSDYD